MSYKQMLSLFPLVSLAILVAALVLVTRRARAGKDAPAGPSKPLPPGVSRATFCWWLVFALVQAFLTVWGALGLISSEVWAPALEAVVAALLGCAILLRERLIQRMEASGRKHAWLVWTVVCLLGACVLSYVAIEVPWNDLLIFMSPKYFLMENALILMAMLVLYFLGQRHGAPAGIVSGACLAIGIAQFYVKNFKNAAILPSDVFALGTAAAVSGGYDFSIYESVLVGVCALLAALFLLSLVRPRAKAEAAAGAADDAQDAKAAEGPADGAEGVGAAPSAETAASPAGAGDEAAGAAPGAAASDEAPAKKRRPHRQLALNLVAAVACGALLAASVAVPSYFGQLGLHMEYWYTTDWYKIQGFLPSFIAVAQDLPIRQPEGYTDQGADQLLADTAAAYRSDTRTGGASTRKVAENQFAETKPNVIVVMNETFSDLSILDNLHADYQGPQFFKNGMPDALSRGSLAVSVQGGGTCNTEFSFLTGNSMAFIGAGKYPYSLYKFDNVTSLASDFKTMGYHTTAMHPNYPSNWNRGTIYPQIGFDDFQSLDDFDGDERFHSGVTDEATYEHALDIIKSSDEPQFIFDVTMQNHGGYDKGDIPASDLTHYSPSDFSSASLDASLNEYLSCIQKSDEALEDLVNQLRELDEPTVLVFFGDHQPTLSATYNNVFFPNEEDQMAHTQRIYQTSYVIWANYKVAGNDQVATEDDTSINYLGAMLCHLIGADVTDYQAAQLQERLAMPVLNLFGYKDADGHWHETNTSIAYASSVARASGAIDEAELEDQYADTDAAKAAAQAFKELSWMQYREFAEKVQ